jgi:hypothetical protein
MRGSGIMVLFYQRKGYIMSNLALLQAQLDIINKKIFSENIAQNNGRVKMVSNIVAVDNLEIDAIQNQKIIDKIESVNAMIDFYNKGGNVQIIPAKGNKRLKRLYR